MNDPALPQPANPKPIYSGWIAFALVLLILVLNLLVIDRFDLGVDEAHYALYGKHLDWSYFDHPPLVGWLQAIALTLSEDEWALRLWAVVLSLVSSLLLYRLVQRLYPDASPHLAPLSVILLQSAVIYQMLSISLMPDSILLPAGLMVALVLHRLFETEESRNRWLLLGLGMGLAALAKYSAITLVVSVLLLLFIRWRCSALLRSGIWQAILLTLILILPVIGWNWSHDWVSFLYQLDHGVPEDESWQWGRFIESQTRQLLTYGPAVYLVGLIGIGWALLNIRTTGHQYLLAFALPILLLFGWGAGLEESLPHWTLLGWAFVTPLAAGWLITQWHRRWVTILGAICGVYALLITVVVHAELYSPWIPFEKNHHPIEDLHGWSEAAVEAANLRDQMAEDGGVEPRLFIGNWSLASRIMWYARPQKVAVLDSRYDQFDIWTGPLAAGDRGILIIPKLMRKKAEAQLAKFESCEAAGFYEKQLRGTTVDRFDFYRCQGLKI